MTLRVSVAFTTMIPRSNVLGQGGDAFKGLEAAHG